MDVQGNDREKSRPPTIDDLEAVCRELNKHDVKYILIGGFAISYYGSERGTKDIDLLIDPSRENIENIRKALAFLPDNAVQEIALNDVEKYGVVRIMDEITVDLMKKACDVTYKNAGIEHSQYKGINIPVADLPTMIKTKQTVRPKDKEDLRFLEDKLKEEQKQERKQKAVIKHPEQDIEHKGRHR